MKQFVTFYIYVCVLVFLSALPGTSNGAVQMEYRSAAGAALILKPARTHIRIIEKNVELRSYAIAADSSSVEEADDSSAVEDADDSSAVEDADDSSAVEVADDSSAVEDADDSSAVEDADDSSAVEDD